MFSGRATFQHGMLSLRGRLLECFAVQVSCNSIKLNFAGCVDAQVCGETDVPILLRKSTPVSGWCRAAHTAVQTCSWRQMRRGFD